MLITIKLEEIKLLLTLLNVNLYCQQFLEYKNSIVNLICNILIIAANTGIVKILDLFFNLLLESRKKYSIS